MFRVSIALVAALAMADACAQAAPASQPTEAVAASAAIPASPATPDPAACCQIPAGTLVRLEILDLLNSSQRKRGDKFGLRVAAPIIVDGKERVPAGTIGVGEIVHAAAARGGGAPGELLIAARSLDLHGQMIPLRGLKLGVAGGDNSGMALGVSLAAGPFALFIRGREIEIPALTRVEAKVAQAVTLAPASLPVPGSHTETQPE